MGFLVSRLSSGQGAAGRSSQTKAGETWQCLCLAVAVPGGSGWLWLLSVSKPCTAALPQEQLPWSRGWERCGGSWKAPNRERVGLWWWHHGADPSFRFCVLFVLQLSLHFPYLPPVPAAQAIVVFSFGKGEGSFALRCLRGYVLTFHYFQCQVVQLLQHWWICGLGQWVALSISHLHYHVTLMVYSNKIFHICLRATWRGYNLGYLV